MTSPCSNLEYGLEKRQIREERKGGKREGEKERKDPSPRVY